MNDALLTNLQRRRKALTRMADAAYAEAHAAGEAKDTESWKLWTSEAIRYGNQRDAIVEQIDELQRRKESQAAA